MSKKPNPDRVLDNPNKNALTCKPSQYHVSCRSRSTFIIIIITTGNPNTIKKAVQSLWTCLSPPKTTTAVDRKSSCRWCKEFEFLHLIRPLSVLPTPLCKYVTHENLFTNHHNATAAVCRLGRYSTINSAGSLSWFSQGLEAICRRCRLCRAPQLTE